MANQILSGAVFQAGQVIAGIDADTILDTFIAPQLLTTTSTRWMIVGAYLDDDNGDSSGSVYVYDATDLSAQPTKLTPFDGTERDRFGNAVAATDDKIIVGAYRYGNDGNDYVGSVYVYDANDLTAQPTKLTAFDSSASDEFGISVSATADKIVVGAYQDDDNGNNSGSVYVYDANDLTAQPTKLTAFDGVGDDLFGNAVSVTADKIVVGAIYEGDGGWPGSGSVYVYDANDLTAQPTKLTPFDGAGGDRFGESVFATVDKIVVGAWRDDDNGNDSGSVYVYDLSDLSAQPTKLTAFDGAANHRFGYSVAATVDKIIVGAEQDDDNGSYSGSVYVYDATDLSAQPTKLTPFDGAEDDHFGYSLDAVSNTLLVGSFYDDGQGSSYIYDLDDLSAQPTKLTAFDGSSNDRFGHSVALCVETTTIPLPAFIAPLSTTTSYLALGDPHYKNSSNQSVGGVYIYNQSDMSAPVTILEGVMYSDSGINYGIHLGSSILLTDTHVIVGNSVNHMEDSIPWNSSGKTPQIMIWSLDDLSSPPTTIFHPDGSAASRFGSNEGEMITMDDKLFVFGHSSGVSDYLIYVYDLTDLSVNPIEITPPNLSGWNIGSFGGSFDIDPVSKKLYVGAWSSAIDGASYGTSAYQSGLVLVYDVSDLSSNINTHIATVPTPSDIGIHGGFGSSIRYHSDKLFIGNMAQAPGGGLRVASLRVYDTSDLSLIQKFDEEYSGQYGSGTDFAKWPRSLDVSDNGVVIGAPRSSPNEDDYRTGEVFVIPMDSSGNLGTLTKLSNSGLSVAAGLAWPGTGGDRLGEHVSSFGDKIYATHKGSSGNNMKTVEWSWSNLSSNGSELSIVDPRSTFDHSGYYYTGMGVSPVPSLPAFIAPPAPASPSSYDWASLTSSDFVELSSANWPDITSGESRGSDSTDTHVMSFGQSDTGDWDIAINLNLSDGTLVKSFIVADDYPEVSHPWLSHCSMNGNYITFTRVPTNITGGFYVKIFDIRNIQQADHGLVNKFTYSDLQSEDISSYQAPRKAFTIDDNRVAMCYGSSWSRCNEIKIHNISDWSVVHTLNTTLGPAYDRSGAMEVDLHGNVLAVGSGYNIGQGPRVVLLNLEDYSTVTINYDSNVHGFIHTAHDEHFGAGLTISDNYVAFNHIRTDSTDENTKVAETVIHIHSLDGTYVRTLTPASANNYYFRSLIDFRIGNNSSEISGDFLIAPTVKHDWSNNMSPFSSALSVYDITSGNLISETVTYDGTRYTPQGSGLFGVWDTFVVSGNSVFDHGQWQDGRDNIPKVALLPTT